GESRDARRDRGTHGDAPHGQVPPPDESDGTVESDDAILEQDGDGPHRRHTVTASDSIGSLSDAPGGIMGNTLASCSIRNSTSAGPSCASAARTTPSTCSARATRNPGMP